jgi:hypothetical protein
MKHLLNGIDKPKYNALRKPLSLNSIQPPTWFSKEFSTQLKLIANNIKGKCSANEKPNILQ